MEKLEGSIYKEMKPKKIRFFKRAKDAIFNFDEYKTFAQEKISISIKYFLKFVLFFSIAMATILIIKTVSTVNKIVIFIENECPEFGFEGNELIVQGENKEFEIGTKEKSFGIVVNSEKENISDVPKANDYEFAIVFLKNKIAFNNEELSNTIILYEGLNQIYSLNNINKQKVIEILLNNRMLNGYMISFGLIVLSSFIIYSIEFILEILILSLIGFLITQIIGIKLKYKPIFNISVYSLTLSILLYIIYSGVNILTGFEIIYFGVAYRAISYVYLITAILIMKSDLTKQTIGPIKIEEEKKEIKEEQEKNKEENKEKEEEKKEKNKSKNKKEENEDDKAPEGTGA